MGKIKKLQWSENSPPTFFIKQNHCYAKTPIGDIVIKWEKGSKYGWSIIEAPWGAWGWGGTLDEAKIEAEREFYKRISKCFEEK